MASWSLVLFALVAAVVAEGPYHLPRPGPSAPAFNYPQSSGSSAGSGLNLHQASVIPVYVPVQAQPQVQSQSHYHSDSSSGYVISRPQNSNLHSGNHGLSNSNNFQTTGVVPILVQLAPQSQLSGSGSFGSQSISPPSTSYGVPVSGPVPSGLQSRPIATSYIQQSIFPASQPLLLVRPQLISISQSQALHNAASGNHHDNSYLPSGRHSQSSKQVEDLDSELDSADSSKSLSPAGPGFSVPSAEYGPPGGSNQHNNLGSFVPDSKPDSSYGVPHKK